MKKGKNRFKKKQGRSKPKISTASLPDIIFMLLFFFMVVTVLRDAEVKVVVQTPQASELTKLEKKSLVSHYYIGNPMQRYQKDHGTASKIQIGDKFTSYNPKDPSVLYGEVALANEKHKATVPENQQAQRVASLKVDKNTTMGIVSDLKIALRKTGQLKINYSSRPND